jgi:hypothetical protein
MLRLDKHDEVLVEQTKRAIQTAVASANMPSAVAKRIVTVAMKHRNKGRSEAMKRQPFKGVCEASGKPLEKKDAVLDELEPEKGYAGKVRWVCPKANNSGKRSCGVC